MAPLAEPGPLRALAALLLLAALTLPAWAEEVLFQKQSPFARVVVAADGPYRIMRFGDIEQSRFDTRRPAYLFHEYTRMQLLGLAYVPAPKRILIVGLGGASLTRALAAALPDTRIDNVEIDPVVVEAARRYFLFREGPQAGTIVQDARLYARETDCRYDLIFQDAFGGDEIPGPLRTREYYESLRRLLNPGGAVVANFMRRSDLYDRDRNTLASIFPQVQAFGGIGNVVVVAGSDLPTPTVEQVEALSRRFGDEYPLADYFAERESAPDWDPQAPVLTD